MEVEFVQGVRMTREAAMDAGEVARELGVRLSVHAPYFINLCSEEKEKVEASLSRLQESLDRGGEAMGATVVVFHRRTTANSALRVAIMPLRMAFSRSLIG